MTYAPRNCLIGFSLAVLGALSAANAQAGVTFFSNDAPGFAGATAGKTLLGTETFEGSTQAPGSVVGFNDPLTQGVANGPYPVGLIQPMTVQSNLSGGAPTTPNPRGGDGLAAASVGFGGAASDVVVANFFVDSLDWIFSPTAQITALGFNTLNFFDPSTLEIRVYNAANALLGTSTIAGEPTGDNFMGLLATGGDFIGRVNFFSLAAGGGAEGGDNAMLFVDAAAVPEPASLALLGAALGAFGLSRRRKARATA